MAAEEKVYPPIRFSPVETHLYRSSYPRSQNFPFLSQLNLRTVISLTPEPPEVDLVTFARENDITIYHFTTLKDHAADFPLKTPSLKKVLELVLDKTKLPILIHCLRGNTATGLVVAAMRVMAGWRKDIALDEYAKFLKSHEVDGESALAFLERLENVGDLRFTEDNLPEWIVRNWSTFDKHPSMTIELPSKSSEEGAS